tara:strand:- start:131 stop:265 length:135 start_codon:yes stop_codon:yes gene_type:complete
MFSNSKNKLEAHARKKEIKKPIQKIYKKPNSLIELDQNKIKEIK